MRLTLMLERAGFETRRGDATRTHGSNPARCRLRKTHPGRAEIFALPILAPGSSFKSWHDCRCMSDPDASEEPGGDPLYEAIVDYCIDSRLGPGYSSP
jgi:hypothetical protein